LKLPAEVDEYYEIKDKCIEAGWQPGQSVGADPNSANAPSRMIAQALMKRAIADIPIVTHVQKESSGMNKLYSQSMCSVTQWRAYQAAEAMVSAEVDEVRAEADEIEPGWSGAIWRQAMQYHQMLKQKHEMEAKAAEEQAKKRKEVEQRVLAAKAEQEQQQTSKSSTATTTTPSATSKDVSANDQDDVRAKELAAEKAAQELLRAEEREKQSKKAFSTKGGTIKKGFLDGKGKKK
jgi:Preprotein translocase subunit Sec66